ncbi:hypothetical protein ACG7TL_006146 [Trametes sanguinea]
MSLSNLARFTFASPDGARIGVPRPKDKSKNRNRRRANRRNRRAQDSKEADPQAGADQGRADQDKDLRADQDRADQDRADAEALTRIRTQEADVQRADRAEEGTPSRTGTQDQDHPSADQDRADPQDPPSADGQVANARTRADGDHTSADEDPRADGDQDEVADARTQDQDVIMSRRGAKQADQDVDMADVEDQDQEPLAKDTKSDAGAGAGGDEETDQNDYRDIFRRMMKLLKGDKSEEEGIKKQEAAKKATQESARKAAKEAARIAAEETAKKAAAEEATRAAAEAARSAAAEAARIATEEAIKKAAEEAARTAAAEHAARIATARKTAEEAARAAVAKAARRAAEDVARKAAEDAARKAAEDAEQREAEDAAQREAEDAAQREAEDAALRAAEEAAWIAEETARAAEFTGLTTIAVATTAMAEPREATTDATAALKANASVADDTNSGGEDVGDVRTKTTNDEGAVAAIEGGSGLEPYQQFNEQAMSDRRTYLEATLASLGISVDEIPPNVTTSTPPTRPAPITRPRTRLNRAQRRERRRAIRRREFQELMADRENLIEDDDPAFPFVDPTQGLASNPLYQPDGTISGDLRAAEYQWRLNEEYTQARLRHRHQARLREIEWERQRQTYLAQQARRGLPPYEYRPLPDLSKAKWRLIERSATFTQEQLDDGERNALAFIEQEAQRLGDAFNKEKMIADEKNRWALWRQDVARCTARVREKRSRQIARML